MFPPDNAVGFLKFSNIAHDRGHILAGDLGLRRHVAEIPVMARGSLAGRPEEGLIVVMAGVVDIVEQGRPLVASRAVNAVAARAVLIEGGAAGGGEGGKRGRTRSP